MLLHKLSTVPQDLNKLSQCFGYTTTIIDEYSYAYYVKCTGGKGKKGTATSAITLWSQGTDQRQGIQRLIKITSSAVKVSGITQQCSTVSYTCKCNYIIAYRYVLTVAIIAPEKYDNLTTIHILIIY